MAAEMENDREEEEEEDEDRAEGSLSERQLKDLISWTSVRSGEQPGGPLELPI